jgi:hydrogenase maturation protease
MSGGVRPLAVLGVGNVLMRDDGVGPAVVEAIRAGVEAGVIHVPAGALLVDGGTRGRGLWPLVADAGGAVIVDAHRRGGRPGTVTVLDGEVLLESGGEVAEMVALAQVDGLAVSSISLVGVEPADLGPGLGLSAPVAEAVPRAALAVLSRLVEMTTHPQSQDPPAATAATHALEPAR